MPNESYGFAQIEPIPDGKWYKWRVWYFKPGTDTTKIQTVHRSRSKAEARVKWWLSTPRTQYNQKDDL